MIDINGNYLDLNTIKLADGTFYSGTDEVKTMIAECYREMEKRFFRKNEPVIFITPGIKSGNGEGNRGYGFARSAIVKTKKGAIPVTWYDTKSTENGRTKYGPVIEHVRNRSISLYEHDIEKILFMSLFVKSVSVNGKLSAKTFLQDLEAQAVEFEMNEVQNAVVSYWLYTPESAFYDNFDKLATIARVYGIDPDGKSTVYLKQLIATEVRRAEKRGDQDLNMKAFRDYCERLNHNYDIRDIEAVNIMAKAIKRKLIHFDYDTFKWSIIDANYKPLKTICKVPPQFGANPKLFLKKHLAEAPDMLEMLQNGLETEPEPSKFDKVKVSVAFPDIVTEEFIMSELNVHDRRRLYNFIMNDPQGAKTKTPQEINPILLEYFVINKRTVPFEVK